MFQNPDDRAIGDLLARARRIAVVGLSPHPHRDSNRIARYLLARGYDVVPVYPREDEILGRKVYRSVAEIPGGVDLVDVFRRSDALAATVDDAIAAHAPALWLQLGCIDEAAAARAAAAGMTVVMDRCIMVDHASLLAP
ncbi:MAG: CoA-binding protein [Acidobacteriota bacterium]